jgi:hypothetical protein
VDEKVHRRGFLKQVGGVGGGLGLALTPGLGLGALAASPSQSSPAGVSLCGSYAEMQGASQPADNTVVWVACRATPGDGGDGLFRYSASSTAAVNGGTVLSATGGGRWIRESSDGLNVLWFGAHGDGVADDTAAIQAAISASSGAPIDLPSGTYLVSGTLSVPPTLRNAFHLRGAGAISTQLRFTGKGAALRLDPSATPSTDTRRQYWRLENLFLNGPGAGVAGSIGLHCNNAFMGQLGHVVIQNFETGLKLDGLGLANGAACYYNTGTNVLVSACGTAVQITGRASSNTFNGGKAASSVVGVRIDAGSTNNTFLGVDIEGNSGKSAGLIDGTGNHLLGCRLENPAAALDLTFNPSGGTTNADGANNTVMAYFSATDIDTRILDNSIAKDNLILWPGRVSFGSPNQSRKEILRGYRYSDANLYPAVDIQDRYTSGGSPIGYRHVSSRLGGIAFEGGRTDSTFSTVYTYFRAQVAPDTGKAQVWLGDYNSNALDVVLYRDAPNVLKTDDQLQAADGVATKTVAGPVTDAAFTAPPPDGTLAVDSTNAQLYVRVGGTWRKVALS